jgi:hypothetical protein
LCLGSGRKNTGKRKSYESRSCFEHKIDVVIYSNILK